MAFSKKIEFSEYWAEVKNLDPRIFFGTLAIVGLAILFRELLGRYQPGIVPFVTLFPAVVIAGVLYGTASAIVTVILCSLAADYLWLPPRGGLLLSDAAGLWNLGLFLTACGFVIWATRLLRVERDRARTYFDVAGSAVVILDRDGLIDEVNERGLKLFGIAHLRDVRRRVRIESFFAVEDRAAFAAAFADALAERRHPRCETRLSGSAQSETTIRWRLVKTRDVGTRARIIAVGYNVSEEINATRAMARSEQRLRAVLQQVPAAVAILEAPTGRVVLRSDRSTEILGHGERNVESVESLLAYGALHADGSPYKADEYPIARALLLGETIEAESLSYLRPDGRLVALEVYAAPIRDPASPGKIIASIGMAFDVSKRKRAEQDLHEALASRELLFREADHRIKNSLQMIAGLLQLQRKRASSSELMKIFDDTIARVNSVAEVHSALQECDDLRSVAFGNILARICHRLAGLSVAVKICYRGTGELLMDAERAIPLGLIATEILTNALRHAFPPGVAGVVTIDAGREHQSLVISIADDGIGMPGEAARQGLGSTIIRALASQIGAEISLRSRPEEGTCFTIRLSEIGVTQPTHDPETAATPRDDGSQPARTRASDDIPPTA